MDLRKWNLGYGGSSAGQFESKIPGWLSLQSAKTKSPNPNSKMNSASRGRENALEIFEVHMPLDYGCVNGPVLSLLPLWLNMTSGTSRAQSKEDGLRPRGRAVGSRSRRPRIISSMPPAVCAVYTGPGHQCVTTPQWGGTLVRGVGKLCGGRTLRIQIAPLLLAVFIPEVSFQDGGPAAGRQCEGNCPVSKLLFKSSGGWRANR